MTKKDQSYHSLIAGLTAGAIEGVATYPTEFVKTQAQLSRQQIFSGNTSNHLNNNKQGGGGISNPIQSRSTHNITAAHYHQSIKQQAIKSSQNSNIKQIILKTFQTKGILGFYEGCIPMATGNALKAGTRFYFYDLIKDSLRTSDGKLTLSRSIFAGFCAGLAEGLIAVTPSESIKTRMIQDSIQNQRKFHGTFHGIQTIIKQEGLTSLYRGLTATMLRQGANSAVRLSSYSAIRSGYEQITKTKIGVTGTFCAGATAGLITVYTTMPFDVIKTRMQSASASNTIQNKGIISCAINIIKTEGILRLWAGTGPRLTRLIFSGGIAFSVYESVMNILR